MSRWLGAVSSLCSATLLAVMARPRCPLFRRLVSTPRSRCPRVPSCPISLRCWRCGGQLQPLLWLLHSKHDNPYLATAPHYSFNIPHLQSDHPLSHHMLTLTLLLLYCARCFATDSLSAEFQVTGIILLSCRRYYFVRGRDQRGLTTSSGFGFRTWSKIVESLSAVLNARLAGI